MNRIATRLPPVVSASGWYYAAHALIIIAGLISMPIMTRLLSKSEYGLLGLVYLTAAVFALIGGLGFGEAAVRLYGEHRDHGSNARLRDLCGTLIAGAFGASTVVAIGLAAAPFVFSGAGNESYMHCLPLAAALVVIRATSAVIFQIYRAEERAGTHALTQIGLRYGTLVVALLFLVLFPRTAFTVILATLTVELAALVVRLNQLRRRQMIGIPRQVRPIFGVAIAYGLPLALAGSARFLLDYADRFLIERMLGLDAVATYGVPYDIAAKLGETLATPIQLAAVPIIFRLWTTEGRVATSRFASDVFSYMIAMALPLTVLYLMYSEEVIVVLASEKYRGAGELTPYLLPGVLLGNVNFLIVAGLTVHKRTTVLAMSVCGAALLNVILNLVLIPYWQLIGAAVATTVSYVTLTIVTFRLAADSIALRLDYRVLIKAVAATAVSVLVLHQLRLIEASSAGTLVLALALGSATAASVFAALDERLRHLAAVQIGGAASWVAQHRSRRS